MACSSSTFSSSLHLATRPSSPLRVTFNEEPDGVTFILNKIFAVVRKRDNGSVFVVRADRGPSAAFEGDDMEAAFTGARAMSASRANVSAAPSLRERLGMCEVDLRGERGGR